jgi:hypothetical protein
MFALFTKLAALALAGILLAACPYPAKASAAFPEVGEVVDAGYGCGSLEDARKLAAAMAEGKADVFVAEADNSCGNGTGRFQVVILEYVAEVNDCKVARAQAPGGEGFKVMCPPKA